MSEEHVMQVYTFTLKGATVTVVTNEFALAQAIVNGLTSYACQQLDSGTIERQLLPLELRLGTWFNIEYKGMHDQHVWFRHRIEGECYARGFKTAYDCGECSGDVCKLIPYYRDIAALSGQVKS